MNLDKYLKTLMPSLEKKDILDDLSNTREEIRKVTLPIYVSLQKEYGRRDFKSEEVRAFAATFDKNVKVGIRGNFFTVILTVLQRAVENTDGIEELVNKYYADDVYRSSMTYLKVNLLQYIEALAFMSRYARKLLRWVVQAELTAMGIDSTETVSSLTPAEMEWLVSRQRPFFTVVEILSFEKKKVIPMLESIPDVLADSQNESYVKRVVGASKLDPLKLGFIPVVLNPIYHVRMAIAEWQVARYQQAQEEKRVLEMRILQLKYLNDGKSDAKLEQQIEYTEGRLGKLNAKLAKMEEDIA